MGQEVKIPRGYRGIIIEADKPDVVRCASGRGEEEGQTKRDQWPLTPATSSASVIGSTSTPMEIEDDGTEMRRSPRKNGLARLKQRVKGAGQVALSRPKKAAVKIGKKRFRLDSDDEDEELTPEPVSPVLAETPNTPTAILQATPSKKSRPNPISTPTRQSPRLSQNPRTPVLSSTRKSQLPAIVLQEATPLKEPLPPPPAHFRRKRGGKADYVIPGSPGAEMKEETEELVTEEAEGSGSGESPSSVEEVSIIPSPSTENDPPTFPIPTSVPVENVKKEPTPSKSTEVDISAIANMMDVSGAIRVLRPVASFDSITLWTPDAPLAGYKAVDTDKPGEDVKDPIPIEEPVPVGDKGKSKAEVEEEEAKGTATKAEQDAEGPKVRQGWWAQGGSGEGGDEVVRAMGEWLGLVEMVSPKIYPVR